MTSFNLDYASQDASLDLILNPWESVDGCSNAEHKFMGKGDRSTPTFEYGHIQVIEDETEYFRGTDRASMAL